MEVSPLILAADIKWAEMVDGDNQVAYTWSLLDGKIECASITDGDDRNVYI